jgi:hypothetical protein
LIVPCVDKRDIEAELALMESRDLITEPGRLIPRKMELAEALLARLTEEDA